MTELHEPGAFYWEVGSDQCPHGAEPDIETEGEAWDLWRDRHPSSDDGPVCLDAPAGDACLACSAEDGEMVPWNRCRVRDHTRPKRAAAQKPEQPTAHVPLTVDVGSLECLERECEDFFDDEGDEIPSKETCSHLSEMEICEGCTGPHKDGEFPVVVAWADCTQRLAAAR
jgi:hypothetical protein